jgi:hypothetical protein
VGLVEVVQVDDEILLGRGVEAEVTEVRITANDRGDTRGGQARNVLGHHDGCAAQESVRRGCHQPDSVRDQPAKPAAMRLDDQLHGIGTVRRC